MDYSLSEKTVSIQWTWTTTGPEPKQYSWQTEAVSFWPTEVVAAGDSRVAIAGKRGDTTIVELWQFGTPTIPQPIQDAFGNVLYPELVVPITSKTVIFSESVVGRDIVRFMFNNPIPPQGVVASLFVHFYDSKDLYRIDVFSDSDVVTSTKIISSTPDPSTPVIQRLGDPFTMSWGADHESIGYVYVFGTSIDDTPLDALVLFDSDRNGTIDGHLTLDGPTWNSQGWGDGDNYVAFF
jgi:hypothetical protein